MKKESKKVGVALSYLTVIATAAMNFVLIPFYLRVLGSDAYGLYEYVYSLAAYAAILDFGIANVMIRYITAYRLKGDKKSEENFAAHALVITGLAMLFIAAIGIVLYLNIEKVIINRNANEMMIARGIFVFMIGRILLAILQHYFDGVLLAYERYIAAKGVACFRIISKLIVIMALVLYSKSVYGIVIGDFTAGLLCILVSANFVYKLDFRPKWYYFDKQLFCEAMVLILALILQSIVNFANNALDKYVVGGFLTNSMVAVYAVALSMYEVYQTITTSINPIFMPKVTAVITTGADSETITDQVITVGRLQAILCLAMLGGFFVFGKQFLIMWSGSETADAWILTILLMTGGTLPLVESTCLSVLTVYNKRLFRSIVLVAVAITNLLLSIILVQSVGITGVALGTFLAFVFGNGIVMNIYYQKRIGLNVFRMIRGIFSGILISAAAAVVVCLPFMLWLNDNIFYFIAGVFVFCLVYCCVLWLYGLKKEEKTLIKNLIMKRSKNEG